MSCEAHEMVTGLKTPMVLLWCGFKTLVADLVPVLAWYREVH